MSEINNGGPAFPQKEPLSNDWHGMSLRDYFAAKAMPACYYEVCRECDISGWTEDWKTGVAMDAYAMADAMLAERERQK